MPDGPVGHDHVVAEDALERRADPGQRGARPLVARMGLELDPLGAERLEGVASAGAAWPRGSRRSAGTPCRPRSSRSRAAGARARSTGSGCCRSPGPLARCRRSRTAARCPPSALASAVSTQRRRPASSCVAHDRPAPHRRIEGDERRGPPGGPRGAARGGRARPRARPVRPTSALPPADGRPRRLLGCPGEPRPLRRAAGRAPRRAPAGGHVHLPGRWLRPSLAALVHLGGRRVHDRDGRQRRQAEAPPARIRGSRSSSTRTSSRIAASRFAARPRLLDVPYGPVIRRIATRYVGEEAAAYLRRRSRRNDRPHRTGRRPRLGLPRRPDRRWGSSRVADLRGDRRRASSPTRSRATRSSRRRSASTPTTPAGRT